MDTTPIARGAVDIKKWDKLQNRLLIGVDSGSSMTKVLFLHKDNSHQLYDDKIEFVTLTHGLFNNANFEEAIKWVRALAYVPDKSGYSVHLTGNYACQRRDIVELIFGLPTIYVDEMLTISAGHIIALEQIGLQQLMSPEVEVESMGQIENSMFEKYANAITARFAKCNDGSSMFPCLVHVYGSLSGFFYFDEEGRGEFSSCLLTGGKSFLGLAKCLLDTNDYDEVIRLASTGNRGNVDTQVKDFINDDKDSPYGRFPPEMPLFCFGKLADTNMTLDDCAKEDLARSLVAFFSFTMITSSGDMIMMKKSTKVYFSGNIFRSNLFKKEIQLIHSIFPLMPSFEILDFGYFGALGAMFCCDEDRQKYYKN